MNPCTCAAARMHLQIIDIVAIVLHRSHQEQSHLIGPSLPGASIQLFPLTVGALITGCMLMEEMLLHVSALLQMRSTDHQFQSALSAPLAWASSIKDAGEEAGCCCPRPTEAHPWWSGFRIQQNYNDNSCPL